MADRERLVGTNNAHVPVIELRLRADSPGMLAGCGQIRRDVEGAVPYGGDEVDADSPGVTGDLDCASAEQCSALRKRGSTG